MISEFKITKNKWWTIAPKYRQNGVEFTCSGACLTFKMTCFVRGGDQLSP